MLNESNMMYDTPVARQGQAPKEPLSEYTLDHIEALAKRIKASALNHKKGEEELVDELSDCAIDLTIQLIEARAGIKRMEDLYRKDHGTVKEAVADMRRHQEKLDQERNRESDLMKKLTTSRFDYMTAVLKYRVRTEECEHRAKEAEELRVRYQTGINELAALKESQQKELIMMATQLWSLKSLSADVVSDAVWTLRDGMDIAQNEINNTIKGLDKMINENLASQISHQNRGIEGNARPSEGSGYSSGTRLQLNGVAYTKPQYPIRRPMTPPGLQSRRSLPVDLENVAGGRLASPQDTCPPSSEMHSVTYPQAHVLNLLENHKKRKAIIRRDIYTQSELENTAFSSCVFDDLDEERASSLKQIQSTDAKYDNKILRDAVRESSDKKAWLSAQSSDHRSNYSESFEDQVPAIVDWGEVPVRRKGSTFSADSVRSCGINRDDSDWIDRPELMDDVQAMLEGELLEKVQSLQARSRQDKMGNSSKKDASATNQKSGKMGDKSCPGTPSRDVDQQNCSTSKKKEKVCNGACSKGTVDMILPQTLDAAPSDGDQVDRDDFQTLREHFRWGDRIDEKTLVARDQGQVYPEDPSVKKTERKRNREERKLRGEERRKEKGKMKMGEDFECPLKPLHLTEQFLRNGNARGNVQVTDQQAILPSVVSAQASWAVIQAANARYADALFETEPQDLNSGISEGGEFKVPGSMIHGKVYPEWRASKFSGRRRWSSRYDEHDVDS
ncbi:unnamed protein product [Diplocarpon coronariae]